MNVTNVMAADNKGYQWKIQNQLSHVLCARFSQIQLRKLEDIEDRRHRKHLHEKSRRETVTVHRFF